MVSTSRPDTYEAWLPGLLADAAVGCTVQFPQPVTIRGLEFTHAKVEREFRTASKAKLVQLLPHGDNYVVKFEDVWQEYAVMCALRAMNQRWRDRGVVLGSSQVEAVTYAILPLGRVAGLISVVNGSQTMRELSQAVSYEQRNQRVGLALQSDPRRLSRLAASAVAYLTSCYVLGVRDGHDDNIMLRSDGSLFRIDFGFVFGRAPEIDAPALVMPNSVTQALGEQRWHEVIGTCGLALHALCNNATAESPGWDCLRTVHQLGPLLHEARMYTRRLSREGFYHAVRHCDEWSFARATKNTLREALRYVLAEEDCPKSAAEPEHKQVTASDDWLGWLGGFVFPTAGSTSTLKGSGSAAATPRAPQPKLAATFGAGHGQRNCDASPCFGGGAPRMMAPRGGDGIPRAGGSTPRMADVTPHMWGGAPRTADGTPRAVGASPHMADGAPPPMFGGAPCSDGGTPRRGGTPQLAVGSPAGFIIPHRASPPAILQSADDPRTRTAVDAHPESRPTIATRPEQRPGDPGFVRPTDLQLAMQREREPSRRMVLLPEQGGASKS